MTAPVLEAQINVNEEVGLGLDPQGSVVCHPSVTWFSTDPAAASFQRGNPSVGSSTVPAGSFTYDDAFLYGVTPGATSVYVVVNGVRYDLTYRISDTAHKKVGLLHVVP